MELINANWRPNTPYKVHKCEYCPKDYVILIWPEEDMACIAKVYDNLPENFQVTSTVYECLTLPSETDTVWYCPWCGEEVLKDDNYVA